MFLRLPVEMCHIESHLYNCSNEFTLVIKGVIGV